MGKGLQIAIPVHGEARHLQAHGQLAQEEGVPQVFIPYNGSLIQLSSPSAQIIDQIHAGKWALDGRRLIPLESIIFLKIATNYQFRESYS